jgi:autotransporter-associated beta strand protein
LSLAASEEFGALAGAGSVLLQGNTLTLGGAAASNFSGVMSGTASVTKAGAGELTLTGANTLSGDFNVNGGGGGFDPSWSQFLGNSIDASWDQQVHQKSGCLALADGSVKHTKTPALRAQISESIANGMSNVVFSKPRGVF